MDKKKNQTNNIGYIIKKMWKHSFFIGMTSVFQPNIITVDSLEFDNSDKENLSRDWMAVGSDIKKSYDYYAAKLQ